MDLFEAKSDRGLERRVDEEDLRNLFRAGHLHLESRVRRTGSPNWFRVDEMFPHFDRLSPTKKYSANLSSPSARVTGWRSVLLIVLSILVLAILVMQFSKKVSAESKPPASQLQSRAK